MSWLTEKTQLVRALRKPRKSGDSRGWPAYLLGGRVRTSTVGLIIAFVAASWLHQTYAPPPAPPPVVVPPGYVPDPAYTWVPRTEVTPYPTTTRQTTPTTTTTTPTTTETTETTTPGEPTTTPSNPSELPTTTVITPAPGILPPITLPVLPGLAPPPPPSTVTTPPLAQEPPGAVTSASPEAPLH